MFFLDLVAAEMEMERRVAERLGEAEDYRVVRQVKAGRRGRLSRHCYRVLSWVGCLLVALGERLQQYGSARPVSLEPAEVLRAE